MHLTPGTRLGPYEVLSTLGHGGMGEVYRARDAKLQRDVALKILPAGFADEPDRVARFDREAQALASLNHPNVATIYGFERLDAQQVIVMELVEGEPLDVRLARGALPLEDVQRIGIQIADALDAAHERGIVHRDLKPSNAIVRTDGTVKVLDFGLAKTRETGRTGSGPSELATATIGAATHAGVILGTAPYMSPEQARGLTVDRRTDIWALGCLLYEAVTGRRAFGGATVSDTVASILTGEPDWAAIPATAPPSLTAAIRRCLRRDPRQRTQSAGDVRLALEELESIESVPKVPASSRWPWLVLGSAALLFVAALGLLVYGVRPHPDAAPRTPVRAHVQLPGQGPLWFEDGVSVAMSRDGRMLAWVGGTGTARRLWVRPIDQLEGRSLEGTEGAATPFFSPDGEWVGFFTPTALKKVKITGGMPVALTAVTDRGRGAAWGDDGSIVFAGGFDSPLRRVAASGGEAAAITRLPAEGNGSHRFPVWIPGRQALLFALRHATARGAGRAAIAAIDLASGSEKIVLEDASQPALLPDGDLAFVRETSLYLIEFDAATLSTRGDPRLIAAALQINSNSMAAQYATGGSRLIYMAAPGTVGESDSVVEWRGIAGASRLLIKEPDTYRDIRFSPDGRRLAYSAFPRDAAATDLWVYDLDRDVKNRLVSSPSADWRAVWSNDGRLIVYSEYSTGLKRVRADGTGSPEQLTRHAPTASQVPASMSGDGKYLAYHESDQRQPADIWILPLQPLDAPFRFFASAASETLPMFSPDGRWIAYVSDESGSAELYVRPFPDADAKWRVSSSGTLDEHAWSRDGTRLFFRSGDGQQLMAAPITVTRTALEIGRATAVLSLQSDSYPDLSIWGGLTAAPDGSGFAFVKYAEQVVGDRSRLVLMLDWIDAVKRAPPGDVPPRQSR